MDGKIVIVDVNNQRFVMSQASDGAVYLTKEISEAKLYNDYVDANADANNFGGEDPNLFLASEGPHGTGKWLAGEYKQVKPVQLVPCKIEAKFKFIPIES